MLLRFGDNIEPMATPTIVKSRVVNDPNGVLLPLNRRRHWQHTLASVAQQDTPAERKLWSVVWRGATTGNCVDFDQHPRTQLVRRWFDADRALIDVAYTEVVQGKERECSGLVRASMSMKHQLRHALIASPEGNDVASNLKWILLSNSVPVMPAPRYESWLLESRLRPMVHYVPVHPDFSDLPKVVAWCRANPAKVSEIARNGKAYMRAFADEKTELALERRVLRRYLGSEWRNHAKPAVLKKSYYHRLRKIFRHG